MALGSEAAGCGRHAPATRLGLLFKASDSEPAVHHNARAICIACCVRNEVQHRPGHLVGFSVPTKRDLLHPFVVCLGVVTNILRIETTVLRAGIEKSRLPYSIRGWPAVAPHETEAVATGPKSWCTWRGTLVRYAPRRPRQNPIIVEGHAAASCC